MPRNRAREFGRTDHRVYRLPSPPSPLLATAFRFGTRTPAKNYIRIDQVLVQNFLSRSGPRLRWGQITLRYWRGRQQAAETRHPREPLPFAVANRLRSTVPRNHVRLTTDRVVD